MLIISSHLREIGCHDVSDLAANSLELLGASFEIVGALMLANRYLRRPSLFSIPSGLISAIWRGEAAKNVAFLGELTEESALTSLRGILLLIVGFVLETVPRITFLSHWLLNHLR